MFDSIRKLRVNKWLDQNVQEIYARKKNKIKIGKKANECLKTTKKCKTEMPVCLFIIYNMRTRHEECSERYKLVGRKKL